MSKSTELGGYKQRKEELSAVSRLAENNNLVNCTRMTKKKQKHFVSVNSRTADDRDPHQPIDADVTVRTAALSRSSWASVYRTVTLLYTALL